MKIALFGASGNIGQRILQEALRRGHSVTAVVRNPAKVTASAEKLTTVSGDVTNPAGVSAAVAGHDAVICAVGSSADQGGPTMFTRTARALIDGLKRAKVRRLIIVGGAGSLEVAPGKQLVDSPEFPSAWKDLALAHRDALQIYRAEKELDWTYLSPAAFIEPGKRTGKFRIGTDQLVVDASGKSAISMEDYAIALLDELEKPKFIRKRFTAAY